MPTENNGPTYAEFADALLNQSLQKQRMPEENVVEKSCRVNLEAIAREQENLG